MAPATATSLTTPALPALQTSFAYRVKIIGTGCVDLVIGRRQSSMTSMSSSCHRRLVRSRAQCRRSNGFDVEVGLFCLFCLFATLLCVSSTTRRFCGVCSAPFLFQGTGATTTGFCKQDVVSFCFVRDLGRRRRRRLGPVDRRAHIVSACLHGAWCMVHCFVDFCRTTLAPPRASVPTACRSTRLARRLPVSRRARCAPCLRSLRAARLLLSFD